MMKDRRKKSIRKRETRRCRFIRLRAREIFSEPVSYCGKEFTEVHIVANLAGYTLTLYNRVAPWKDRPCPIGVHTHWGQYDQPSEFTVTHAVENMLTVARAGELTNLREQQYTACLF